ncbi:MAG: glycosyltransferase [Planctomycetota bacterium]|nr:MAG: glycosyltransferase [Planctomycetota bacterium]
MLEHSQNEVDISIVIPVFNEKDSLATLCQEIREVLEKEGWNYEILFIDDGSTDGSREVFQRLVEDVPQVKAILFRRNYGQTAAMDCGFSQAKGKYVVPLDGDGQNDPKNIPKMIHYLEQEGLHVVSGWRRNRQDGWVRTFFSKVANGLISRVSGIPLHDYGCSLKVYRREILEDIHLYGEMHRLIPLYVKRAGGRIGEVEVSHRERQWGKSKYNLGRTFKVLIDLFTARFLTHHFFKPAYFFGKISLLAGAVSLISLLGSIYFYLQNNQIMAMGVFILAVLFFMAGGALVFMGLFAEILMRIYFESQGKRPYVIERILPSSSAGTEDNLPQKEAP